MRGGELLGVSRTGHCYLCFVIDLCRTPFTGFRLSGRFSVGGFCVFVVTNLQFTSTLSSVGLWFVHGFLESFLCFQLGPILN